MNFVGVLLQESAHDHKHCAGRQQEIDLREKSKACISPCVRFHQMNTVVRVVGPQDIRVMLLAAGVVFTRRSTGPVV